jgi:hypothetical protein
MPKLGNVGESRSLTLPLATVLAIFAFVLAAYATAIWDYSFGPELCFFYWWNHDRTLIDVLKEYVPTPGHKWYRPSAFFLPYWALSPILGWHNVIGFKFAQACTLIGAACGVAWISLLLFPGYRLGALLAAFYFAVYPGCYSILLQNSAFDFLHIITAAGAVGCFLIARRSDRPGRWLTAAVLLYIAALTSKEITFVTPLYLAVISAVDLWLSPGSKPRSVRIRREAAILAPFLLAMAMFYFSHVRHLPDADEGIYRNQPNARLIRQNLVNYPLWTVRIFSEAGENKGLAAGLDNRHTLYSGLLLLLLVIGQWVRDLRREAALWRPFLLCVAWIAVFLIVPVYSGAYIWHNDLAVGGYAILFGVAMERLIAYTPRPRLPAALLIVLLLVLGLVSANDTIYRGMHATQYRMARALMNAGGPPLPESQIPPSSLVYYEDRLSLGSWTYGGIDRMFRWWYLRPDLKEKSVPVLASIPGQVFAEWISAPHAFFFVYDDELRWHDATATFRKLAAEALPAYTDELLARNQDQEVFALLDPLLRRADLHLPGRVSGNYVIAAKRLNRPPDALGR